MRTLAVLVLVSALLTLVVSCDTGVGEQSLQSEDQSKSQQIEEATKEFLGGEIPAEDYRN